MTKTEIAAAKSIRLEVRVRVAGHTETELRYGLVSYRWSEAPSFLFGEDSEEAGSGLPGDLIG